MCHKNDGDVFLLRGSDGVWTFATFTTDVSTGIASSSNLVAQLCAIHRFAFNPAVFRHKFNTIYYVLAHAVEYIKPYAQKTPTFQNAYPEAVAALRGKDWLWAHTYETKDLKNVECVLDMCKTEFVRVRNLAYVAMVNLHNAIKDRYFLAIQATIEIPNVIAQLIATYLVDLPFNIFDSLPVFTVSDYQLANHDPPHGAAFVVPAVPAVPAT
jgi:hypothetical protein